MDCNYHCVFYSKEPNETPYCDFKKDYIERCGKCKYYTTMEEVVEFVKDNIDKTNL